MPLALFGVKKGVILNWKTILLSVLSIFAVLFFVFANFDLEPIFFNTKWKFHRWIYYLYLPFLMTYVLYLVWIKIKSINWIENFIKWAAIRSYEIFLAQMAAIACIKTFIPTLTSNGIVLYVILAIVIFVFSFLLGGLIFWFQKKILK